MPKHYNQRESFEALLRGETVVEEDGTRQKFEGAVLRRHIVERTESDWYTCAFLRNGSAPHIEPNPHPVGSFNWARFENRTRAVKRNVFLGRTPVGAVFKPGRMDDHNWHISAIDAMDWMHA